MGYCLSLKMAVIGPRNHLWMYDGRSLVGLLCHLGFTDVSIMLPGNDKYRGPGVS